MNRGFNYYFREGVKSSAVSLFKNKGLIKFFAWFFMELFGRLTIILNPIFSLAAVRQGEMVRINKNIDLSQSFKDAGKPLSVWTYVLTVMVEALMVLGGLLVIAVVAVLLGLIGYAVGQFTEDLNLVTLLFMLPAGAVAVVYLIVMALMFAPTPFIIANNPGLGVADTLSVCFNTMKSRGKLTLVLSVVIPALIVLAYLAAVGAAGYFLLELIQADMTLTIVIYAVWILVSFIGFVIIASIFLLASRTAVNNLFADIVTDPVSADMNTNGVNVLKFKGAKVAGGSVEDTLVSIFDETEADTYALLGDIKNKPEKPAPDASVFMPEADLGTAIQFKKSKKKIKSGKPVGEQEEPLPTVSGVLNAEVTEEEKEIKIPSAVEPALAGVEPSVEKIIEDAEKRARQEKEDRQPSAIEEKPAPVPPAQPVHEEADELEDELDEELDDGLDEPAETQKGE